jgi:signal transduction histidine kinase/DNA-binding response OmpR family regulator/ligand-binding sensor domain-containing protein
LYATTALKMKKFYCIMLFLCLFGCIFAQQEKQEYYSVTNFTDAEGFPMSPINDMLQDQKGNLWMATHDGIVAYNGRTFSWYEQDNHYHVRLKSIFEDHNGRIWAIDNDGALYTINKQEHTYGCILGKSFKISALHHVKDGDVWGICDNSSLSRITIDQDGQMKIKIYLFGKIKIKSIFDDSYGNLWVLTNNGIYFIRKNASKWHLLTSSIKDHGNEFTASAVIASQVVFGTNDGCLYKYDYASGKFCCFSKPFSSEVVSIQSLKDGKYAATSKYQGIAVYSRSNRLLHHTTLSSDKGKGQSVKIATADSKDRIWVSYRHSSIISCYDTKSFTCKSFDIGGNSKNYVKWKLRNFVEDKYGQVWICCDNYYIFKYDENSQCLNPVYPDNMKEVRIGFADRQGNFWIGQNGNLIRISRTDHFQMFDEQHNQKVNSLSFNDGKIIAAYNDFTVKVYDSNLKEEGYLNKQGRIQQQPVLFGNVTATYYSGRSHTLWVTDRMQGLYRFAGEIGKSTNCINDTKGDTKKQESCTDYLTDVTETPKGHIWVGTVEYGPQRITTDGNKTLFDNIFNHLGNYPKKEFARISCMKVDSHGALWLGTTTGLAYCANPDAPAEKLHFRFFNHDWNDTTSICGDYITAIIENKRHEIFISSSNGINKVVSASKGQFKRFQNVNMSYSNFIVTMQLDKYQRIWGSYMSHLLCLDTNTGKWTDCNSWNFPLSAQVGATSCTTDTHDNILFGTSKGIMSFTPPRTINQPFIPQIQLEELFVNGETVTSGKEPLLTTPLDECKKLTLPKSKNSFRIVFTAVDLSSSSTIKYRVRLKGLEKNWDELGNINQINYSNIPKGHYVLQIQSTNLSGTWIDNQREIAITVLPSFFESFWGIVLIILLSISAVALTIYLILRFMRLKDAVKMEKQMMDIRTSSFTDIVHELRTPLTLVKGSLDLVLEQNQLDADDRRRLESVSRNTNHLNELATQLLDWQKISSKHMKLCVTRTDLSKLVATVSHRFDDYAKSHAIDYDIRISAENILVWADIKKIESVLLNIISNAFKYTPDGKKISVTLDEDSTQALIAVEDHGVGISAEKMDKIFDRFENNLSASMFSSSSTGLGLSLAKELVEMHNGTISVDSKENEGTKIMIRLLKGKEQLPQDTDYIYNDVNVSAAMFQETEIKPSLDWDFSKEYGNQKSGLTLLVVDDNSEICSYVTDIFAADYHIICAENGQAALDKTLLCNPDIIISDIIMPVMDGITLLQNLRSSIQTSHIPVVMLTTKASVEDQVKSFALGIDDYVTKPFSAKLLRTRVDAILEKRKQLQTLYLSKYIPTGSPETSREADNQESKQNDEPMLSSKESEFMDRLHTIVSDKLADSELSVEFLAREFGISRSIFTHKTKALLGITPIDLIKDMRIKKSAEMITTTDLTFSEIAYQTGFTDPHYFSKCFRAAYDVTPTEYREMKKKDGKGSSN